MSKVRELRSVLADDEIEFANKYLSRRSGELAIAEMYPMYTKEECVMKISEYMSNEPLWEYIGLLDGAMIGARELTLDDTLMGMAMIARSNIDDFLGPDGEISLKNANRLQRYAVQEYSHTERDGKRTVKIRFHNKLQALKEIGIHLGGFRGDAQARSENSLEVILGKAEAKVHESSSPDSTPTTDQLLPPTPPQKPSPHPPKPKPKFTDLTLEEEQARREEDIKKLF